MEGHMSTINISPEEKDALKAIDGVMLSRLIEQCLREKRPDALRSLRLENCGPHVYAKFRAYGEYLGEYADAKAEKKRAETERRANRAASDLAIAVQLMKDRLETEEMEGLLFYVEDQVFPPDRFTERVAVRVNYRWRPSVEDAWAHGSITFSHTVDLRADYIWPSPKRKSSAAKQAEAREEKLYGTWENLVRLALFSVRDYFRDGGNGGEIPETFQVRTDLFTRGLNNFSAKFWV